MKSYLDLKPGKGYFIAPFNKQCIVVEAEELQIKALVKMIHVIDAAGRDNTPIKQVEKDVLNCPFAKYLFKNYDCLPDKIKELLKGGNKGYLLIIYEHGSWTIPFDRYHAGKLGKILATRISIDKVRLASLSKDNKNEGM